MLLQHQTIFWYLSLRKIEIKPKSVFGVLIFDNSELLKE